MKLPSKCANLVCCFVLIALGAASAQAQGQGFVYVANFFGGVSAYSIDATTGTLTAVPGSPFPTGNNPVSVAVDPTGQFAYVANCGSNPCDGAQGSISAYTISGTTGALTSVIGSPFAAGTNTQSVTVDPAGQFVYVANMDSNNISAYSIDVTTGAGVSQGLA